VTTDNTRPETNGYCYELDCEYRISSKIVNVSLHSYDMGLKYMRLTTEFCFVRQHACMAGIVDPRGHVVNTPIHIRRLPDFHGFTQLREAIIGIAPQITLRPLFTTAFPMYDSLIVLMLKALLQYSYLRLAKYKK
jgi:hypothetical protein